MSIYAISWVLQHSEAEGTDRLVLIALADYARDDGGGAFPSVANIAKKARVKERATQYALRRLEGEGHIEKSGVTPKGTNVYRVLMGGADHAPPGGAPGGEGGCTVAPEGVHEDAPGVHADAPNPSIDPSEDPSKDPSPTSSPEQLQHPPGEDELTVDSVVSELFLAWHAGTERNGNAKLTPARAKTLRRRVEESMETAPEGEDPLSWARRELLYALAGFVNSTWHRDNGHRNFDQIFRDRDRIDAGIERRREQERKRSGVDHQVAAGSNGSQPVADPRFAEYDTTTPNPELQGEADDD